MKSVPTRRRSGVAALLGVAFFGLVAISVMRYRSVMAVAVDYDSSTLGKMRAIPGGTFQMGSAAEVGRDDEHPQHPVTLGPFWLMEHEVTQRQWKAVMGSNPANFTQCGEDCPVERVSWVDATAFAVKVSEQEGKTYRLPTEAEWELAARCASTTDVYSGGSNAEAVGWIDTNSGHITHPVCTAATPRSACGLCDMTGNVWEWTQDFYGPYIGGSATEPLGAPSGAYRAIRGGAWFNPAQDAAVAHRNWSVPAFSGNRLGFRLLRSSGEP